MDPSQRARRIAWLMAFALAVPLLVRAFELRLPGMVRPVWQDEIHHNEPILSSANMAELEANTMYQYMVQPKLDFWMRKAIWFPLLGVSERTIRMPALVYGVALVLLVYVVLILFLRARLELRWAVLLAFAASFWIASNPMEVQYSSEARHYSLIAFASTAFCACLLLFEGRPRPLLGAAALLLANTHFFALPLLAAGYALQLGRELVKRKWGWILFHLLVCLCIYESVFRLNADTFNLLLHEPPGNRGTHPTLLSLIFTADALKAGLAIWSQFGRALAVPPATWAVWLLMLAAVVLRRELGWVPTLIATCVVCPLLFTYARARSAYPWGDRYFSAFFGLGVVTLAAGLDVVLREWRRLSPRLSERRHTVAATVGAIALVTLLGAPWSTYRLFADVRNIRRVPANFSSFYLAYRELWGERKPILILHAFRYTTDIQRFYFRHVLPLNGITYRYFDVLGVDANLGLLKTSGIPWFLNSFVSEGAFLVLDEKETDCAGRTVPPVAPPIRVERVQSTTVCVWKVRNATTTAQVAQVADLVGFRGAPQLH